MNYFSLLNLSATFDVNLPALEAAYFKAQRLYHPDRYVGKPALERHAALQRSMDVNQAYECLKNPLKRAQYLLRLQEVIVGTEADNVKPSPALLMEIMEWNEALAEVEVAEKRTQLVAELRAVQQETLSEIAAHFQQQAWQPMAQATLRLGYLEKMLATRL